MNTNFTAERLLMLQALPLDLKIEMTKRRVEEFVDKMGGWDKVFISFSGGKDSTVLAHIILQMNPNVKMVFCNTGLEFPENVRFVKEKRDLENWDIDIVFPKLTFKKVVEKYGYPIISKEQAQYIYQWRNTKSEKMKKDRWEGVPPNGNFGISKKWRNITLNYDIKISNKCCDVMKKNPVKKYEKETGRRAIIGTMTEESRIRRTSWLKRGCNSFQEGNEKCKPMSIWLEKDVLEYIDKFNIKISDAYSLGYKRTGCFCCGFGCHRDKGENRFQLLEKTHPKLHKVAIENFGMGKVLEAINVKYKADKIEEENLKLF